MTARVAAGNAHLEAVVYSIIEAFGPVSLDGIHRRLEQSGNGVDVTRQVVRLVGAGAVTCRGGELWEVAR